MVTFAFEIGVLEFALYKEPVPEGMASTEALQWASCKRQLLPTRTCVAGRSERCGHHLIVRSVAIAGSEESWTLTPGSGAP